MRQVMNGTRGIPVGIGESGPSPRPRGPFEPRHAAPRPPAAAATERQRLGMMIACIIMASAVAGAAGTAAWDWPVGAITAGTTLVGLLWVLAAWWALKRYTTQAEPPCLHAVLNRTEGNVARMCCNAERCPLLHPEDRS